MAHQPKFENGFVEEGEEDTKAKAEVGVQRRKKTRKSYEMRQMMKSNCRRSSGGAFQH
jgi:hypothetical protein